MASGRTQEATKQSIVKDEQTNVAIQCTGIGDGGPGVQSEVIVLIVYAHLHIRKPQFGYTMALSSKPLVTSLKL